VRRHLEAVLAQAVAEVAGRAVEQRVAGRQDHHALPPCRFYLADDRVQIAADLDFFGFAAGGRGQRLPRPDQHLRLIRQLPSAGRQPFQAVVADADDLTLLAARCLRFAVPAL
jgi:hypothetical protein